jgi:RNA polymerase sigma factor (sigma-70 family)
MSDTGHLLRDYTEKGSEASFRELVGRYMDLVYSVAFRRTGGDAHLAEDVVQTVFTDLARKARSLDANAMLGGWLHRHTCFVSSTLMRGERRRQERERQAMEMNALLQSGDAPWEEIAPVLDEAVNELDDDDRRAVLLRFFEQQDLRSLGAALGTSEGAAQKRVSRALDKLRALLAQRGVTLSIAGLATALGTRTLLAAPAGLSARVSKAALRSVAAGVGLVSLLLKLSTPAKIAVAVCAVAVAVLVAPSLLRDSKSEIRPANELASSKALPDRNPSPASLAGALNQSPVSSNAGPANSPAANPGKLRITIVAADSGKPVPNVPIELRGWQGTLRLKRDFQSNREGVGDVIFPENITGLELTTRLEGFADTRLHWRPDRGEKIPAACALRLVRPIRIGGRVVDPDDRPVTGAKVGFNHDDDPANASSPEDHEFFWIETTTDADGRWSINRIAPEMIHRLRGGASHPEYANSGYLSLPNETPSNEKRAEEELRRGTFLFKLGPTVTVRGTVVDADSQPVPDAKVSVGRVGDSGRREAPSEFDGSFTLRGCRPGKNLLSAEAKGFSATTLEVELSAESAPFRIMLQRGKILRMRIANKKGNPIQKANVWLNTFQPRLVDADHPQPEPVQAEFESESDADGRVVWEDAPDTELTFDIAASGYMRVDGVRVRPDGEEHVITMPPALTISGTVGDDATGEPIPRFRIVTGWPSVQYVNGAMTNIAQWSTLERFWLSFTGGTYHHSFEELVINGVADPSFIFKFEADGYAPLVSRTIRADEGEVRLDVTLTKAASAIVTVLSPAGSPLAGVSVGLVSPGAWLSLNAGGLSQQPNQSSGTLLITDEQGHFRLPPDDAITRVVAANPLGFAEAAPAALAASPVLQLQSWGRLEGTYLAGGRPAEGRTVLLQYGSDDSTLSSSLTAETDAQGRFTISQAPPGRHKLARVVVAKISPTMTSSQRLPLTEAEILSGQTTSVTLGASNYTVTARFRWPEGMKREASWRVFAAIHTPFPKPPEHLINNAEALGKWRQTPEIQELAAKARSYPITEEADGSWIASEVLPGDYNLTVNVLDLPPTGGQGSNRAHAFAAVAVPTDPPSGTLDLGEITLQTQ